MQAAHGISASLSSLGTPVVESGHVAGWVGVGGPGQGPGGTNEWIQVGLNSLPGTGNRLYYEVMRPGMATTTYAEVATAVTNGQAVRVAVLETSAYPNSWRVWVNGRAVTPPIELAGSHGRLTPMAMGESWDGGRPACNRYSYRFDRVSVAGSPGGSWQAPREAAVLQDPGYRVVQRAATSFDASATRPLPAATPVTPAAPASTPTPAPAPTPAAGRRVQVVTARPVAAASPLRKGFVPTPSLDAVLGVVTGPAVSAQPVVPEPPAPAAVVAAPADATATPVEDPGLGIGAVGSYVVPGEQQI